MPALPNPKHERFAQELAKGKTVAESVAISGMELSRVDCIADFYVYLLIDPRTDTVFYVGKGKGRRYSDHVREWYAGEIINAPKFERIGEIIRSGNIVDERCLSHGLSEENALDLEHWLIKAIGRDRLTNLVSGGQSESTKSAAMLRDCVKRIRPFCRWKQFILPQFKNSGMSPEKHEQFYWDITGMMVEHLAELEGKPHRRYPMMHKSAA